ncbi:DUF1631 family protein [Aerolutibacter ruishenii]|uniref:Uncharacterized protein DUF1631 n=1 Tax=Aerolutibacter ruishenii TaxID=686800 RepID=A0A562LYL2_9GAMM|nr:DUF1631 family protein [Lysobacter ruishenii]TWI12731.1 uncharacterized protein DUF1631 [Lysobacter ruishenii]
MDPHELVFGLQHLCSESLDEVIESALRRTDDYLFDRAQVGADGVELTALRDLRRVRGEIAQRFGQSAVAGFRTFLGLSAEVGKKPVVLSLVGEEDLQQQLADEQLVDNLARLHAQALAALDARMVALAARASLPGGDNPAGPKALANAMRDGMRGSELSPNVGIALVKFLERELGEALHDLYGRMNERLAAAGILPSLEAPAPRPKAAPVTAPQPAAVDDPAAPGGGDTAFFNSLVGLLQGWRQRLSGPEHGRAMAGGLGMPMPSSDVMSVLHRMQQHPPAGLSQAVGDSGVSLADQLRRELLATAQRLGMAREDTSLGSADEDAVDLVGMLFDVLMGERDFEPGARQKIGRLLVPYVRVAVKDRRMFLYKGHPARRLLNVVAEACEGNHGEGPQERQLLEQVDGVIERVVAEYNEDVAIFETLEQELRGYLDQHRKRMELAEKRAAEAQRGRERLEQARESAAAEVSALRAGRELPPALGEFLSHYVTHHLSQVVLREGQGSPRYAEAVHAVMGLLVSFDHAELGAPPERLPALERSPLSAILESSGCVGHAAEETLSALHHTLARIAEGDAGAGQQVLPPPPPMPAAAPAVVEPLLAVVNQGPELDFDADMAEQIRALEIGSWVQLTSESGRSEPAKVSWVSPISARLLFVNRRGIRVLVASAEELAAMVKAGRMALRGVDNAFEDSMRQVMGRLQAEVGAPV